MPEIGTSGSMSEDGKRSVAKWPKLPRLSSTLPSRKSQDVRFGRPLGVLGRNDLVRALKERGPGASVADEMTADIPTVIQEKSVSAVGVVDEAG
jgi:hypothetical protein